MLESTRDEQPDLFTLDDKKRIDEINELLKDAPADTRYDDYEFSIVSDSEAAEIRRRAEADGTFMRAPNGKPTNLTERQWLQVRTRAFKEWFGDWEKAARIEKLKHSNPIKITGKEYEGKYELNRESAKAYIKENLRGKYQNEDTGDTILLAKDGAQKVTSHSMGNDAHLKSIAAIPELIEKSIFIDELPNEKNNDKYESYRYYVSGLNIGGVDYTVKLAIGVDEFGNKYYDHSLTQIEKGKLIDEVGALSTTLPSNGQSTLSEYKDTKLISILQTNSSKVVDENGEPLVVYHGTPNTFTVFDKDKIGSNTDPGWLGSGFYFYGNNIDYAYGYSRGGNVMEVFLNIRDPYYASYSEMNRLAEENSREASEEFREMVEEDGCDGVYYNADLNEEWVAFSPSQIKSATDNVGTFDSTNDDIRFDRSDTETETEADTAARREATETVLQLLRDAGLKVELEDESVLWDMADAALEAKRKRSAPETAELTPEGEAYATVVSSADGAKVLKNIDTLAKEYENNNPTRPKTFIGDIANALGAERKGSSSQYATFETKNGRLVTIRLSNHNAKVSNFDNNGEHNGISIVVSGTPNVGINNNGDAHVVEFFYSDKALRKADGKPLAAIARSIGQALYSGEYTDTTGLAEREEVNVPQMSIRTYHGSGADFTAFDHSHMGEGEGAQAYFPMQNLLKMLPSTSSVVI